ncbi:MAG: SUMF1/EgtB/PvdO family nonheme iron enzyme, partial [Planctomycetota bacterium]|nr:SUMF1/EgtB/PvdO family nonheme iron enzyme [Planctomycetota bacterium]
SLGVMLYEMLAGAPPFRGDSMLKLITSITGKEPKPIMDVSKLNAPPALHTLVMNCLNKEPSERPTALECKQRLQSMSQDNPELYLEISTDSSQEEAASSANASAITIAPEGDFRHAQTMVSEEDMEDDEESTPTPPPQSSKRSPKTGSSNIGLWAAAALVVVAAVALSFVATSKSHSSLVLNAPAQGSILSDRELLVKGKAKPGTILRWGSRQTSADDQGHFEFRAKLAAGAQTVIVEELGSEGVIEKIERSIILDYDKPVVLLSSPRTFVTQSESLIIKGSAKDDSTAVLVKVNGEVVELDPQGQFQATIPLIEGKNDITIEASDKADHAISPIRWTCLRDSKGTVISVLGIKDGDWVPSKLSLKGTVLGATPVTGLTVNGQLVSMNGAEFQVDIKVNSDPFLLTLLAKDQAGNLTKKELRLRWDVVPPEIVIKGEKGGAIRLAEGEKLEGSVIEKNLKYLMIDGEKISVQKGGQFSYDISPGSKISLKAVDQAGLSVTKDLRVAEELKAEDLTQATLFLSDISKWRGATAAQQDAVLKIVSVSLGQDYQPLESQEFRSGLLKNRLGRFLHKKSGVVFHLIPGGTFSMGQSAGRSDEAPVHTVIISKPFLIAAMELGQEEWDKVGGSDKRSFTGPDRPIDSVSWVDAKAWLAKAGGQLRLPSESEWEYACRGGSTGQYYWGPSFDESYVWGQSNAGRKSAPRSKHKTRVNPFGLTDMIGNLYEWVEDDWADSYQGAPADGSPRVIKNSRKKVIRGGYWGSKERDLRSAERSGAGPTLPTSRIGFRPARSLNLN